MFKVIKVEGNVDILIEDNIPNREEAEYAVAENLIKDPKGMYIIERK